jgi:hypothetical protein
LARLGPSFGAAAICLGLPGAATLGWHHSAHRRQHPRRAQAADAPSAGTMRRCRVNAIVQGMGRRRRRHVTSDSHRRSSKSSRRNRQLDGARPWCWIPAAVRCNDAIALGRRWRGLGAMRTTVGVLVRSQSDASVNAPAFVPRRLVRVDVRAFLLLSGKHALPCRTARACPRPPDLDGRSRRRREGGELFRGGSDDRGAGHRASRQIHLRHGRRRRLCCRSR